MTQAAKRGSNNCKNKRLFSLATSTMGPLSQEEKDERKAKVIID
jgi:hypothetical protein